MVVSRDETTVLVDPRAGNICEELQAWAAGEQLSIYRRSGESRSIR
jgi:hypothetical protein